MGTIEEIVKLARAGTAKSGQSGLRPVPGAPGRTTRTMQQGRVSMENPGAEWIASLREQEIDVAGLAERRVIAGIHDDRINMAYKMLRTRALQRLRQRDWHVIMVSSPDKGDGKSLTALNLSFSLARETTLSVVLLDLDLRRPVSTEYLGMSAPLGIVDYLEGKASMEDVLCRPAGVERLAIMPNTSIYENSSELISCPRMGELMTTLRGHDKGRVIICDLPPLLATDDALAFSPYADALLLVLSEGGTSRESLSRAAGLLENIEILGVVLNRSAEDFATGYSYY